MDVLKYFIYDSKNGSLWWKQPPKNKPFLFGKKAGHLEITKYGDKRIVVGLNGKTFYLHELIWLVETGSFPIGVIDHINGNSLDNRFSNLRDVTHRINASNQYRHRDGKLVGTSLCKRSQKWRSTIKIDGKTVHLGLFSTEVQAHDRYMEVLKNV